MESDFYLHPQIAEEMIQRLHSLEQIMEATRYISGDRQRDRKNVLRGLRIAKNALKAFTEKR